MLVYLKVPSQYIIPNYSTYNIYVYNNYNIHRTGILGSAHDRNSIKTATIFHPVSSYKTEHKGPIQYVILLLWLGKKILPEFMRIGLSRRFIAYIPILFTN